MEAASGLDGPRPWHAQCPRWGGARTRQRRGLRCCAEMGQRPKTQRHDAVVRRRSPVPRPRVACSRAARCPWSRLGPAAGGARTSRVSVVDGPPCRGPLTAAPWTAPRGTLPPFAAAPSRTSHALRPSCVLQSWRPRRRQSPRRAGAARPRKRSGPRAR